MDKEFLDEQKNKLEKEKKEIERELKILTKKGKISEHLKVKYPQLGDEEDENAEEVEEYIENLDLEGHLEDILKNIKEALLRIKEDKYGFCEKCGKKINKARLEAYAAATLCIKDQNKEEKQKLPR